MFCFKSSVVIFKRECGNPYPTTYMLFSLLENINHWAKTQTQSWSRKYCYCVNSINANSVKPSLVLWGVCHLHSVVCILVGNSWQTKDHNWTGRTEAPVSWATTSYSLMFGSFHQNLTTCLSICWWSFCLWILSQFEFIARQADDTDCTYKTSL